MVPSNLLNHTQNESTKSAPSEKINGHKRLFEKKIIIRANYFSL